MTVQGSITGYAIPINDKVITDETFKFMHDNNLSLELTKKNEDILLKYAKKHNVKISGILGFIDNPQNQEFYGEKSHQANLIERIKDVFKELVELNGQDEVHLIYGSPASRKNINKSDSYSEIDMLRKLDETLDRVLKHNKGKLLIEPLQRDNKQDSGIKSVHDINKLQQDYGDAYSSTLMHIGTMIDTAQLINQKDDGLEQDAAIDSLVDRVHFSLPDLEDFSSFLYNIDESDKKDAIEIIWQTLEMQIMLAKSYNQTLQVSYEAQDDSVSDEQKLKSIKLFSIELDIMIEKSDQIVKNLSSQDE